MISIEHLTVEFGGKPIFNDIGFLIRARDRIALTGKNGAGKTTLLRVISGEQPPTKGTVSIPKNVTIGYLPQHVKHDSHLSVFEEAEKAFAHITRLTEDIERMNEELARRTDYDSTTYQTLIDRLARANEHLQIIHAGNFHADIEKTLTGLGFCRDDFHRSCSEFSGGWRMRIELAKILLMRTDVLLLDEPTNHLDIESIQWLENFLLSSDNTIVLVSHDKAFIDAVSNRTIEISLGKIYDYPVNYSKYVELRKARREQQIRAYENQQKMIQDTKEFIERFRYKATKAVQVQSRIKQLEKIDLIEIDQEDTSKLNLKFPSAPRSGSIPVEMEQLSKAYGEHLVLDKINMVINRGEKVAFVGKNGEGKSTLVKCIMGEVAYDGKLKLGHNVKIGYFAQNQASLLDEERTVFETVDHVATGDIRTKIRDILGAFMFGGEAIDKKVKVLSGGERSRLAMIRLLLEPVNLLLLDEPTNHLDMRSKEVLKEALTDFNGTAIIVSHDREFLDGLVNKVYEFGNRQVREHLGGIYDFLRTKKIDSLQALEISATRKPTTPSGEKEASVNKLGYEARKELNRKIRKAEKDLETTETAVAVLENEIADMNRLMEQPDKAADKEFLTLYEKKRHELEQKMYEWELLSEEVERLTAQLK